VYFSNATDLLHVVAIVDSSLHKHDQRRTVAFDRTLLINFGQHFEKRNSKAAIQKGKR